MYDILTRFGPRRSLKPIKNVGFSILHSLGSLVFVFFCSSIIFGSLGVVRVLSWGVLGTLRCSCAALWPVLEAVLGHWVWSGRCYGVPLGLPAALLLLSGLLWSSFCVLGTRFRVPLGCLRLVWWCPGVLMALPGIVLTLSGAPETVPGRLWELLGAPRSPQELPGAVSGAPRSCQELPGDARSCQELFSSCLELPGADRSCQELPGAARSCQELPRAT